MKKILRKITKKYLKKYMGINLNDIEEGKYAKREDIKSDLPNNIDHPDQMFGGRTFAQHGDDLMILNIFKKLGIDKGTYWDIGAHHPYNISNTALLYKKGWRGINIEANPNLIENFYKERPDDINLCIGLGAKESVMPFYMIDDWSGRNSFDKEEVENFVKEYPEFKIRKIQEIKVEPLQNILQKYAQGKYPDLMDMDVENMEYEILKNCNFSNDGPKLIVIEFPDEKLQKLITKWGYFIYCIMGANAFFVRNEYKDLLYGCKNK